MGSVGVLTWSDFARNLKLRVSEDKTFLNLLGYYLCVLLVTLFSLLSFKLLEESGLWRKSSCLQESQTLQLTEEVVPWEWVLGGQELDQCHQKSWGWFWMRSQINLLQICQLAIVLTKISCHSPQHLTDWGDQSILQRTSLITSVCISPWPQAKSPLSVLLSRLSFPLVFMTCPSQPVDVALHPQPSFSWTLFAAKTIILFWVWIYWLHFSFWYIFLLVTAIKFILIVTLPYW